MRDAIARAAVGDDVLRDDPTVAALEARSADLFGRAAALFVPSGTMANQIALKCYVEPGDEVLCAAGSHILWYEGGAGAAIAGALMTPLGDGGLFTARDVDAYVRPPSDSTPRLGVVWVENTHNRSGGRVFPFDGIERLRALTRERGIGFHLDGARIFNACVASGIATRSFGAAFDSLSFCLSKGLGAPVGSVLVGDAAFIARARRYRRMLGGAMRQAGLLAAAGVYALAHNIDRLAIDHANAKLFADRVSHDFRVLSAPETNIVVVESTADAAAIVARAAEKGVLLYALGSRTIRAVTHLDVTEDDVRRAADVLCETATELERA